MKSFLIAPTCIIAGLGTTAGMDIIQVPGATGDYHTNFQAKTNAAVENLTQGKYDFGFLHIKAVDDAGHDRNVNLKVKRSSHRLKIHRYIKLWLDCHLGRVSGENRLDAERYYYTSGKGRNRAGEQCRGEYIDKA